MLHYAVVFFVVALIAALFGFGGIAAGAVGIAKILFFIFVVLFVFWKVFKRTRAWRPDEMDFVTVRRLVGFGAVMQWGADGVVLSRDRLSRPSRRQKSPRYQLRRSSARSAPPSSEHPFLADPPTPHYHPHSAPRILTCTHPGSCSVTLSYYSHPPLYI